MAQAVSGVDVHVDVMSIEKQLAGLWRAEQDAQGAITRAALWNVVAHTWTARQHAEAAEVLARVSASVPQRTVIVQADPRGAASMSSWISANCHLVGGGKQQVCSEEVSVVAAGERVHHIPPIVSALLLPDMPVAVWWVGDLQGEHADYVESLLEPADRLIVDSSHFDTPGDLELVARVAEHTTTAPADLNWARCDEWRAATAALFDPPSMRRRLGSIRNVRIIAGGDDSFGARAVALLYAAWLITQSGSNAAYEIVHEGDARGIAAVAIEFRDGSMALVRREGESGAVVAHSAASETRLDCVARPLAQATEDLIVRLLKRPEADRVYIRTLQTARRLLS